MSDPLKLPAGATLVSDDAESKLPPGATLVSGDIPKERTAMESVQDFAGELWKKVNPVTALYGARDLANHPVQSLKSDAAAREKVFQKAEEEFKAGNHAAGAAHLLYSFIPMIGPQLSEAGSDFEKGEIAKGAGASVGLGLSMAAPDAIKSVPIPAAIKNAATNISERMYQSALKPPPGSYSSADVGNMVKTGLHNEIPVSASGAEKLSDLISDLNDKVKAQIRYGSKQGATVDPLAVANKTDLLKSKFENQVNPEADLQAIDASKAEFLRQHSTPPAQGIGPSNLSQIPADEAQSIKSGTYQQLKGKSYGELKSAAVESQKALARGIKEELETQFPEIKDFNAKQGNMIGLDEALERAVRRVNNRDIFSLGGKVAAGTGAALGTAAHETALGGIAGLALHYVLSDPMVQSKLAIALSRGSAGKFVPSAATARIAGYVDALGNAANSANSADQTNQQPK